MLQFRDIMCSNLVLNIAPKHLSNINTDFYHFIKQSNILQYQLRENSITSLHNTQQTKLMTTIGLKSYIYVLYYQAVDEKTFHKSNL